MLFPPVLMKSGLFVQLQEALFYDDNWQLYLLGIKNTLLMTLLALSIGVFLGVLIAAIKHTYKSTGKLKILYGLSSLYTTAIRGTPVMVQLMIINFVIFRTVSIPKIIIGGLAFGLNSGAYVSEIIRGGINGVDKGQAETGRSLGLSHGQTMRLIVLPQAVRSIVPALFNELIALVKETAVASTISVIDITFAGDMIRSKDMNVISLFVVAGIYLIIVLGLEQVQKVVERKVAHQ